MRVCQFRHIRDCLYIISQTSGKVKSFFQVFLLKKNNYFKDYLLTNRRIESILKT